MLALLSCICSPQSSFNTASRHTLALGMVLPEFCLGWGGTIIDWARPRAHHLGFRVSQGERPYREPHTEASALMCLPYFQMVSNCFSSSLGFPTQRRFVSAIAEEAQTGELMVELQQSDLQCLAYAITQ